MDFNILADKPLEKYRQSDISIVFLTILLWGIGIFTLYISSDAYGLRSHGDSFYFVKRQLVGSAIGFGFFVFFAVVKMESLKKILPYIVMGAIVLSYLTNFPGIGMEKNGARRWINLKILTFQPSELIKFVIVLYLANYFEKQSKIPEALDKSVFPAVVLTFIMVVSILLQSDFSTAVFVASLAVVLFIVSGSKIFWLAPVVTIIVPLGILFITLEPYRLARITGFLNQDENLQTMNYQLSAARKAISAGGLLGQGLGSGLMKINNVPEVWSDYIFAAWAEANGFCGVLGYFVILGLFAWRGLVSAIKCSSRFASIAALGFTVSIVTQSVLNIAVVCGVVPTTGFPLPFFSSGGTSLMFTLAGCGFLVNASRITDISNDVSPVEEVIYE